MELSLFTDYSLRTLIYVGLNADRNVTVSEVAGAYGLSENHLVKIAHRLAKEGYLSSTRGRNGGLRLGAAPESIVLGDVVRTTESLALVECLGADGGSCPIDGACFLKKVIAEARDAFLGTFDRYTLADLLRSRKALIAALS